MSIAVSATLAVNEALDERRRQGKPVLPLGFGEAGLPVHPALRAQLAAAVGRNAYGPVAGSPDIRRAAAGYWDRRDLPTDPALVVAGPGSKPLLYGLLLAIGGDLVVPCPSWVSYAAQVQLTGREALFVPTAPGEGGVPDPDAMAAAVTRARSAGRTVNSVVVTLPDNPTGTLAGAETVRRFSEVARTLDLVIIADEIYRDLVYDDAAAGFASPSAYAPERTVVTTALSKSLALGGWRLGVARLPDSPLGRELRTELLGTASEIWSCPSAPIQQVAAYAFGEPAELVDHVARSRRLHGIVSGAVADRFRAAKAALATPRAAFYQYPDFATWRGSLALDHDVHTGADLAGLLMRRYGLGVLPASAFGEEPEALRLRVATGLLYGETPEQREAALAASDPLALPWIGAALDRIEEVLADVTGV